MTEDRKLLDHAAEFAKFAFDKTGELQPMWLLDDGADNMFVVMSPFHGDTSKDQTAEEIKKLIADKNIVRIAFMAEAWCVELDKDHPDYDDAKDGHFSTAPSKHEDRREIIHILTESKNGMISGRYYILRPETGKASLSPFKVDDDLVMAGGRFTNLLKSGRKAN